MKISDFSIGSSDTNEDYFLYRNMGINGYVIAPMEWEDYLMVI